MNIVIILGTIGFFSCLLVMYVTNHGIKGIRRYEQSFRLLDMQFRYNSRHVYHTFEKLGVDGRNAYINFLLLDFFFIICFFIVMVAISQKFVHNNLVKDVLVLLALSRGIFDVFENLLLISLMRQYPTQNIVLANICSWSTTIKFVAMFLWILGIISGVSFIRF